MADAKARLVEAVNGLTVATFRAIEDAGKDSFAAPEVIARRQRDILRRALATALPPEPPGPVTSEEAVAAYAAGYARACGVFREHTEEALAQKRKAGMDAAMPLLARDHGLLTPAEVERRAREWWRRGGGGFSGLVTALTAPAATGEASTASSPPVCASCGERKEKCNGC